MEEQKILFADLYRLVGGIKDEAKFTGKEAEKVLMSYADWESLSLVINGIISEAQAIGAMAQAIIDNADLFLRNGPYIGESAHVLPLESLTKDA